MYEAEREFALDVTAQASLLARRVQEEIVANSDALTKGDRSPVTMADLAIQAVALALVDHGHQPTAFGNHRSHVPYFIASSIHASQRPSFPASQRPSVPAILRSTTRFVGRKTNDHSRESVIR